MINIGRIARPSKKNTKHLALLVVIIASAIIFNMIGLNKNVLGDAKEITTETEESEMVEHTTGPTQGIPGAEVEWTTPTTTDYSYNIKKRGAYWIYVPTSSDDVDPATLGFRKLASGKHITGCAEAGGFYMLVTQYYYQKKPSEQMLGMFTMGGVYAAGGFIKEDVGGLPGGPGTPTPESVARQAWFDYEAEHLANGEPPYSTTSTLTAFCASERTIIRKERKVKKYSPEFNCIDERESGDTKSRIAVVNWSLDGGNLVNSTDVNAYENLSLTSSSPRDGLKTDSRSTRIADDVEIIARPGDSIQFLHEICMGARRTREVYSKNQDKEWVYANHDRVNQMKGVDQKFVIEDNANGKYLFGNNIDPVNGYGDVKNFGTIGGTYDNGSSLGDRADAIFKIQSNKDAGLVVREDNDRDALGLVSPSLGNEDYRCDIALYNGTIINGKSFGGANEFVDSSFQIPGFISREDAAKCQSANKTGNSNNVGAGKEIIQKHTFTYISLYEKYATTLTGSCGCNDPTARQGDNIVRNDAGDGKGNWWGNRNPARPYKCNNGRAGDYDCACNEKYEEEYSYDCEPCDAFGNCATCTGKRPACGYWSNRLLYGYLYGGKTAPEYKYHSVMEGPEDREKTATVYVPYNFNTSVTATLNSGEGAVVFQGGKVDSDFSWSIDARDNDKMGKTTGSSFSYATVTPAHTRILAVEFILPVETQDVREGSLTGIHDPGKSATKDSICSYFGGSNCNELYNESGSRNKAGDYAGDAGTLGTKSRIVPDDGDYVGKKYCVAVGIYPSDSHDYEIYGNNTLDQQKTSGPGGAMDAGEYWNISNASCRTIAKKPKVQVWNGSVYTRGSIYTSLTRKVVGVSGGDYNIDNTTLFGSWVDYGIIANKNAFSTGTGAKLGYENEKYNFGLGGGLKGGSIAYRDIQPQTISNSGTGGHSNVDATSSINMNLERLKSRYKDKVTGLYKNTQDKKTIYTTKTGLQYVYNDGNLKISDIKLDVNGRNNNINAYNTLGGYVNGGAIVKGVCHSGGKPCESTDNTLVIVVDGTLTIDKNVCLAERNNQCEGDTRATDATRLITYNNIRTNAPSSMPQILIFAKDVNIKQNVTRIDAWIIAPEGTIDTCEEFIPSKIGVVGSDANMCKKTLVVNGPVYAGHIYLLRTAGSHFGTGSESIRDANGDVLKRSVGDIGDSEDMNKGSIAPAEIFNLRADSYIWAYNQAQRYSEAVVTYTRELAPRY